MDSITSSVDGDWADEGEDKKTRKSAKGRKLMRWNPDIDQLVLLCVDHVCVKQSIQIPWDLVASEVEDHLTGEAIKQHLVKLRQAREQIGRKVPAKLDKNTRRRIGKLANAMLATPAKGGRGRKVNGRVDDDVEEAPPMKNAGLLWTIQKQVRAPKKQGAAAGATPKTPSTGRGRKKAEADGDGDQEADGGFCAPNTKSTSKRGRKTKEAKKEQVSDETEDESPAKKQKTIALRATHRVNYNEQPDHDEDVFDATQGERDDGAYDDEEEEEQAATQSAVKMQPGSSQGSSTYELPQPPPFPRPSAPGLGQDYQPIMTSNTFGHTNYQYATSYDQSFTSPMSGLPGYGEVPYMMHGNHRNFNGAPNNVFEPFYGGSGFPSIGSYMKDDHMGYGGYDTGMPGFYSAPAQQFREQGFRDTDDAAMDSSADETLAQTEAMRAQDRKWTLKADGKSSAPNKDMATCGVGGGQQATGAGLVNKLENNARGADGDAFDYNDQAAGNIPIMNATGGGNGSGNSGGSGFGNFIDFDFAHGGGDAGLHVNTQVSPMQQVQFATSPDNYDNKGYRLVEGNGNSDANPFINQNRVEDQLPQVNQVERHNGSFDSGLSSVIGSQTLEATPRLMQDYDEFNTGRGPFDASAYEQQLPSDEYVDDELMGMSLFQH